MSSDNNSNTATTATTIENNTVDNFLRAVSNLEAADSTKHPAVEFKHRMWALSRIAPQVCFKCSGQTTQSKILKPIALFVIINCIRI